MTRAAETCRRLEQFLASRMPSSTSVTVDGYEPIVGGYSRVMARFTAHVDGTPHELIMRADPLDTNVTIDSDRDQEWSLLRTLTEQGCVPMPPALHYDDGGVWMGSKTIILEAVKGRSLLAEARDQTSKTVQNPVADYAELAARIHSVDVTRLPSEIEAPASWDAYIDQRIAEWVYAEAEHIDRNPLFRYLAAWLRDNKPEPAPLCLVHGELQPSNIMVNERAELLAVDWEFAHVGDPREDLAWCTWVETMQPPTIITGDPDRLSELYTQCSGLDPKLVTPESLRYFSIISGLRAMQSLYMQVRETVEGRNNSLLPAYLTAVLTSAHDLWRSATLPER